MNSLGRGISGENFRVWREKEGKFNLKHEVVFSSNLESILTFKYGDKELLRAYNLFTHI